MGQDKWRMTLGRSTVLERIVEAVRGQVAEMWVLLPYGSEEAMREAVTALVPEVRIACDEAAGAGPLAGIEAGLRRSGCEGNLVIAADMPFIRWPIAEALFEACEGKNVDAAIPEREGRVHPLFAVYRQSALPILEKYRRVDQGRKVMEWVGRLSTVTVGDAAFDRIDPDRMAFFNMNTPEHYELAIRRIDMEKQ
jgi:molybdopterin-guanine dinucleotide biosynthesis protein A